MYTTCLNCGHSIDDKFCPRCGQKATVKRLTASALMVDVFHFFTHLDHGFPKTTWKFVVSPGASAMDYLEGRRKEYQKPVSYFLIWTGIYILIHNAIVNYLHMQITLEVVDQADLNQQANILFRNHFTLFLLPVLISSTLLIYYILAKPVFNYVEVLTISLFGAGTYFMISLLSDLVLGLIFRINLLTAGVFLWQGILSSIFNFWFSYDLFKRLRIRYFWPRMISVAILVAATGWVIMVYLPMAWIYYAMPHLK